MIWFPELRSTIGTGEIETASIDLPHHLVIRSQAANYSKDCGFMMFPHDIENNFYTLENYILSYEQDETYYGHLNFAQINSKTTVDLNLDNIKQYYRYVEVFQFNYMQGDVDFFVAEKNLNDSSKPNVLFGYTSNLKAGTKHLHIGTFARIDDDRWKFYPKMDTSRSQLEIIETYLDMQQ